MHFAIVKSRIGGINTIGGKITIRYNTGIDAVYDLLMIAIPAGFISRPNTKTYCLVDLNTGETLINEDKEMIFKSYDELESYLRAHPAFVKTYSKMICDYAAQTRRSVNLLDEETFNSLLDQEESTCPTDLTESEALAADGVDDE